MKLISNDSKVYITDGFAKQYIGSPAVMADLLKVTGQSSSIGVSKATVDWLEDYVPGKSHRLDHLNLTNQVENLRRIVVDLHV